MVVLSKPTTERDSGTAIPSERAAERTPRADASLAAKMALGGRRADNSSRADVRPWPWCNPRPRRLPGAQAVLAHRREELLAAERGAGAVSSVDVGDAPVPEGDEVFGSQGGADGVVDGDPVDTLDAATGNDRGNLRSQLLNLGGRKLGAEQGLARRRGVTGRLRWRRARVRHRESRMSSRSCSGAPCSAAASPSSISA